MNSTRMWMVRAGEDAYLFNDFKNKNIITIGFNDIGDISKMKDYIEIRNTVKKIHPEYKEGQISLSAGMLSKFKFDFNGRNRRPPKDPVNTLLSYAYSLLAKDVTVICLAVGFDPFLGFYHRPRYGRPALALDVMEEFRPIIADSVVLSVINNGVLDRNDFIQRGPSCTMKPAARKKFIQTYAKDVQNLDI